MVFRQIVGIVLCVVGTGLFWYRRHLAPIRARSTSLVLLSSIGTLSTSLLRVGFEEYVTAPKMPCDIAFLSGMVRTRLGIGLVTLAKLCAWVS